MKPYWLPLLVLGTHLSVFTPSALAVESETIAKPVTNVETSQTGFNKWEDPWQSELDADTSLEKGFHRRRRRRSGLRHRDRNRRLRYRTGRAQVIIIRRGDRHDVFRQGEFRRGDIFFRNDPFRSDRFHRDSFRRNRLRHNRFYDDRFDYDGFRLIIRGD